MTAEDKKDSKLVVLAFIIVSLLTLGSILIDFKWIDVVYLVVLLVYFARYLHLKKNK